MSDWLFDIVPMYQKGDEYYLPLKYGSVVTEPDIVEFDSANNRLIPKGLCFFPSDKKGEPISSVMDVTVHDKEEKEKRLAGSSIEIRADWEIHLLENTIEMTVSYSDSIDNQRLLTFWHPIFIHCICGQSTPAESIEYSKNAKLHGTGKVKLIDEQGRIPQITINSENSQISHGRDASYPTPPVQISPSGITATSSSIILASVIRKN